MHHQCSERLYGEFAAEGYSNGGTLYKDAVEYNMTRSMAECHAAPHYERICMALDAFMIDDKVDVCNSVGCEILGRWGYGYRKATSNVTKADHWKGSKGQLRTRWDLLDRYDPLFYAKQGPTVAPADLQVQDTMKQEALFDKYYDRTRTDGATVAPTSGTGR